VVDDAIDKAEKGAGQYPPYLVKDWVYRLKQCRLRYTHWKMDPHAANKEITSWKLGEDLMIILIHMKNSRSSAPEILQALTEAKEDQREDRLFQNCKKQKAAWKKVETSTVSAVKKLMESNRRDNNSNNHRRPEASTKKNENRPPEKGGREFRK